MLLCIEVDTAEPLRFQASCSLAILACGAVISDAYAPQHFLYFLPLPHGHRSFLPIFGAALTGLETPKPGLGLVSEETSIGPSAASRLPS